MFVMPLEFRRIIYKVIIYGNKIYIKIYISQQISKDSSSILIKLKTTIYINSVVTL